MFFQLAALAVLLAFYGCYFAKMLAQRRKGIQTDQIGKGKTGLVKTVELTMKVATIAVPLAEIVSIALNATALPVWARALGLSLALAGDAVFIAAVLTMRDSWRAGVSETDKTDLVTSGVYRFSRNPAFLGFDLVYLGLLLMFFNWALCALSCFAALMFHLQIVNVEEAFLLSVFGDEYLEYRKHVGRYVGRRE